MPDRKYLTGDEIGRLLNSLSGTDVDREDRLLIQLGISLGCRVSEVVNIKLINIEGRVIKIYDQKKDEYRVCVIDSSTQGLLEGYLRDDYKVPHGMTRDNQKLFYFTSKTANRKIKDAFEKAGISKNVPWRWHTLRHSYIVRILQKMKDGGLKVAIDQTGDSASTILDYYSKLSLDDRLKVADEYSVIKEG